MIEQLQKAAELIQPIFNKHRDDFSDFRQAKENFSAIVYIASKRKNMEMFTETVMQRSCYADIDTDLLEELQDTDTLKHIKEAPFLLMSYLD